MHTGQSYRLFEFLDWTRRDIYVLIVLGVVPAVAYQTGNMKWLGIPWTVVALLGSATAFIVGFKNVQSYNRTWEARHIWGDIISSSRAWEAMSKANAEYLRYYSIPEMQTPLETELAKFLPDAELTQILATRSKATQI